MLYNFTSIETLDSYNEVNDEKFKNLIAILGSFYNNLAKLFAVVYKKKYRVKRKTIGK